MAYLHFDNVSIAALAGALPEFVQEINTDPDHPDAAYIKNFIRQTGVKSRHISIMEQTSTDLGYAAMEAALSKAGWHTKDLDGLIFLTQTPDFNNATGNAFVMHNHLHMRKEALAFDIAQGCASFPYGLAVGAGFLQQPDINRIALVSGDSMWPLYPDRQTLLDDPVFLTGEGTTVTLLEKKPSPRIDIALLSDGSGYYHLYNPSAGIRHAWRKPVGILPNGAIYEGGSYMDGMEITTFSTMQVVSDIKAFVDYFHIDLDKIDGLILHQANMQIVKTMAKRLKIDMTKTPVTLDRLGNTNGASVTLTMIDAYAGRTEPLNLLISAFGIGLSWGIMNLWLDPRIISPMITTNIRFDEDFLKIEQNG